MQIHRFRGKSLREALQRARREVGDKAVVISHRAGAGGAVTLAVADEVPRSPDALRAMRDRAREVLEPAPEGAGGLADTVDVERCLAASGCSRRLVARVTEAVAGRLAEGTHPLDLAAEELGSVFPVARSRHTRGTTQVLAFVGASGSGKTTVVAKLAARLARSGRRTVLASLDSGRVGAQEELRAFGALVGCPVVALRDAAQLVPALARGHCEVVLLDTTGAVTRDLAQIRKLEAAIAASGLDARLETYHVYSAASSRGALAAGAARAAGHALAGCVITNLDQVVQPAPALEHAVARKLPIAFLCDGPDLERHLQRARPACFADLMLRGRFSR